MKSLVHAGIKQRSSKRKVLALMKVTRQEESAMIKDIKAIQKDLLGWHKNVMSSLLQVILMSACQSLYMYDIASKLFIWFMLKLGMLVRKPWVRAVARVDNAGEKSAAWAMARVNSGVDLLGGLDICVIKHIQISKVGFGSTVACENDFIIIVHMDSVVIENHFATHITKVVHRKERAGCKVHQDVDMVSSWKCLKSKFHLMSGEDDCPIGIVDGSWGISDPFIDNECIDFAKMCHAAIVSDGHGANNCGRTNHSK